MEDTTLSQLVLRLLLAMAVLLPMNVKFASLENVWQPNADTRELNAAAPLKFDHLLSNRTNKFQKNFKKKIYFKFH